jgi:tripartite-type tricarboxylate transporter receptor subunit TctC
VSSWHGLFVPAQTPREIVTKLNADTIAALADPVTKGKLEQAGYTVVGSTPDELHTLLKSEMDKWGAVIEAAESRRSEAVETAYQWQLLAHDFTCCKATIYPKLGT